MKKSRGFTIVELLVVIATIGLLATIITASYSGAKKSSRDAQRSTDAETIKNAVTSYFVDNRTYPKCDSTMPNLTQPGYTPKCFYGFSDLVTEENMPIIKPYLDPMPRDPLSKYGYIYVSGTNTNSGPGNPVTQTATPQFGILIGYEKNNVKGCNSQHPTRSIPGGFYSAYLTPAVYSEDATRCVCKTGDNMEDSWWSVSWNGSDWTGTPQEKVPNCQ